MINFFNEHEQKLFRDYYCENHNYEYVKCSNQLSEKILFVFFTSNDVWLTTFESFYESIMINDRYDYKNITSTDYFCCAGDKLFIRDINKAWYYYGINAITSSRDSLLDLLQELCKDKTVITVGSSAGGYAAIFFGTRLNAKRIMVFDPQIDVELYLSVYDSKGPYRYINNDILNKTPKLMTDIKLFKNNIYLFYSSESLIDVRQVELISGIKNVYLFPIKSNEHGRTILGENMIDILLMIDDNLKKISAKILCKKTGPILFLFESCSFFRAIGILFRKFKRIISMV